MADNRPSIVFADKKGNIFDFEPLAMVGRSGDYLIPIEDSDIIPVPKGGQFYVLPDRHPIGMDRQTGQIITLKENPFDPSSPAFAVAIFLAAAYTQTYLAAWEPCEYAINLPLFAYTALGWADGFVTTAIRTDTSTRRDIDTFNMDTVRKGVEIWKSSLPENRLVTHLAHCALVVYLINPVVIPLLPREG